MYVKSILVLFLSFLSIGLKASTGAESYTMKVDSSFSYVAMSNDGELYAMDKGVNQYDEWGNLVRGIAYQSGSGAGGWDAHYQVEYVYSSRRVLLQEIVSNIAMEDYLLHYEGRKDHMYDEVGNRIKTVQYRWKDEQWNLYSSTEYSYDSSNNIVFQGRSNYTLNEWVVLDKREYSFDESNNRTYEIYQKWDENSSMWIPQDSTYYAYDDRGNITFELESEWNESILLWIPEDKCENSYDTLGNLTFKLANYWDVGSSQWLLFDKRMHEYTYYNTNEVLEKVSSKWDKVSGQWVLNSKEVKDTLVSNATFKQILNYSWDETDTIWFNDRRSEVYYSSHIDSASIISNELLDIDSLVAYWPFSANTNDVSQNKLHAEAHGAVLTTDRFGIPNSAYSFDGVDDYVFVNDTSLLNPDNLTICCWYKTTSFNEDGYNAIIDKASDLQSALTAQYYIGINGIGASDSDSLNYASELSVDSSKVQVNTGKFSWVPDRWSFLSATYDGDVFRFYIDDVLTQQVEIHGVLKSGSQDLYFGKSSNSDTYTSGCIDDVRVYSKALNEEELHRLYQDGCVFQGTAIADTNVYYVSSQEFKDVGSRVNYLGEEVLFKEDCLCEITVANYEMFVFDSQHYTDTISEVVYISVHDTLVIDGYLESSISHQFNGEIKLYPNPTKDYIIINTLGMDGASPLNLTITTTSGKTVFVSPLDDPEVMVDIVGIGGSGLYFVEIRNAQNDLLTIKKVLVR